MTPAAAGPPAERERTVRVAVGVGSNVGDREESLRFAVRELERRLTRLRASSVYWSEPREGARGGPFLNACVAGEWTYGVEGEPSPAASAERLLEELRHVEFGAGRPLRRGSGEPRTLDLDLLLFGEHRIRRPGLEVPHPRMADRAFVLRPLAEIAPEWRHRGLDATVAELAARVDAGGLAGHRPPDRIA